jgi:hypothetical protein
MDVEAKLDFSSAEHGGAAMWMPRLSRLLNEQIQLATKLNAIGEVRSEALAASDIEKYVELLDQREAPISEMLAKSEQINPFIHRMPTLMASLKHSEQEGLRNQLRQLDDLLELINQRDEAEAQLLAFERSALARALAEHHVGAHAVARYTGIGQEDDQGPLLSDREVSA